MAFSSTLNKAKEALLSIVLIGSTIALLTVQPDFRIAFSVIFAVLAFSILIHYESNEEENNRLSILEKIMTDNGYDQIVTLKQVSELEQNAHSISVITDSLLTDLDEHVLNQQKNIDDDTVGILYSEVKHNLSKGISYEYFIKDYGDETRQIIDIFNKSHNNPKNVSFVLIPQAEFCFFSEIYVYSCESKNIKNSVFAQNIEKGKKYAHFAVEWLSAISNHHTKSMFYINLEKQQVNDIQKILLGLEKKYKN